jgi:epoxyqueuosine reductase
MFSEESRIEEGIKAEARRLGFALCGISRPKSPGGFSRFSAWIEKGMYGEMRYLARPDTLRKRENPAFLLEHCKSVICLALPYPPSESPGNIAAFARVPDYHELLREKLAQLASYIERTLGRELSAYIAVDSSPVLEKSLAVQAGLGLLGKHTLLINEHYGSWLFLGELFIDVELEPDLPFEGDFCADCKICVDACPTGALLGDKTMNASKCISYLTIEHRGKIPEDIRKRMSGQVVGCDICQVLCPMNKAIKLNAHNYELPQVLPANLDLPACLALDEESFKAMFGKTTVMRLKYKSFRRNVVLAMAHSANQEFLQILQTAITDEEDSICKDAMQWALETIRQTLSKK